VNIHNPPQRGKGTKKSQSLRAACQHLEALGRDPLHPMCFRVIAETDAAKAFVADKKNHPMRFRYRGTINGMFDELKRRNDAGFAIYYVLNETDGNPRKQGTSDKARVLALFVFIEVGMGRLELLKCFRPAHGPILVLIADGIELK
jgi:hypothetical protein